MHLSIIFIVIAAFSVAGAASANADNTLTIFTEQSPLEADFDPQTKVANGTTALIQLLAERLNEKVSIQILPWARAFSLVKNQPHTAIYETARTSEREKLFKWVGPLKFYTIRLYGRSDLVAVDTPITHLSKNHTACVQRGSPFVRYFQQLGFDVNRNLILAVAVEDCRDLLLKKRTDIFLWNEQFVALVNSTLEADGASLIPLADVDKVALYLAFSVEHDDAYIQRWQQALEVSYRDGTMRSLYTGVYPEQMIKRLEQFAKSTKNVN